MNLADLFTVTTLTASINKLPLMPSKIGALNLFQDEGVTTSTVTIEEWQGKLKLIPNTSVNADPIPLAANKRKRKTFQLSHLPEIRQILPSELQNIAPFGGETNVIQQQSTIINNKLQEMRNCIEATREWYRMGALSGQILDADGSVLIDLFTEFGISKRTANIAFSTSTTNVLKAVMDAKRSAETALGGNMATGWIAFCDAGFYDALVGHATVKAAFAGYQQAADRLGGDQRGGFVYGGVTFIEYNVTVSGQPFVPTNTARLVPLAPSIYKFYNGPANYIETVNTLGLPFYSKAEPRKMGKGWDIEAQANPVALCLSPEALYELKAT